MAQAGLFTNTYTSMGMPASVGRIIGKSAMAQAITKAERLKVKELMARVKPGNTYQVVTIGDQTWMAENLAYLPEVHDNKEFGIRGNSSQPAYGVYGYDGNDVNTAKQYTLLKEEGNINAYETYGVLYNWYAITTTENVCPAGWHVPSDSEWNELTDFIIVRTINSPLLSRFNDG